VRPSGVVTVIDGTAASMDLTVTVIFSCTAAVTPGRAPLPLVTAASREGSAGLAPVVPAAYEKLSKEVSANLLGSPENRDRGFDADVEWWVANDDTVTKRWQEWSRA